MPQYAMPRTDGMSADGLSYSVAGDFNKQMAQALAEYEARTAQPRFVPGARVEQPDAPELLRQELIDPLEHAWGMDRRGPAQNPIARVVGNSLVEYDPRNRRTNVLYSNPTVAKPVHTPELTKRQQNDLEMITYTMKQKQKALSAALNDEVKAALGAELMDLENKRQAVFNEGRQPVVSLEGPPEATNSPEIRMPQSFMGTPGGPNLFQGPAAAPAAAPSAFVPSRGDLQASEAIQVPPDLISPTTRSNSFGAPGKINSFGAPGRIPQAANTNEVIRYVNGKPAVFDSKTKKFIRYAD